MGVSTRYVSQPVAAHEAAINKKKKAACKSLT